MGTRNGGPLARRLVAALIFAFALVASACGGSHGAGSHSDSGATVAVAADATFNEADVRFVQGMIPHHEQAVEMSTIALDPAVGASAVVVDLARRISAAQGPEIEQMRGYLTTWNQSEMGMDHSGHDMKGMISGDEMTGLAQARGSEFDRLFLSAMIAHHEGAVASAEAVQAAGRDPEVKALAGAIIAAQEAEIAEMKGR